MVTQITVFLENTKGRLSEMCRCMSDADVNMCALTIAETADYGVVRVICDNPKVAHEALEADGFRVMETDVIAIELPNRPGGLADLLDQFDEVDINIEYGYCFSSETKRAIVVIKVHNNERAIQGLKEAGFTTLELEEIL